METNIVKEIEQNEGNELEIMNRTVNPPEVNITPEDVPEVPLEEQAPSTPSEEITDINTKEANKFQEDLDPTNEEAKEPKSIFDAMMDSYDSMSDEDIAMGRQFESKKDPSGKKPNMADVYVPLVTAPIRAVTQYGAIAMDLSNSIDNAVGSGLISDDYAARTEKYFNFKPSFAGANPDSDLYTGVAAISDAILTSAQILMGIGAVKTVAKVGTKQAMKQFATQGLKQTAKTTAAAGKEAITSGSKAAKYAKMAAVGAIEEGIRNPQEGNIFNATKSFMENGDNSDLDLVEHLEKQTLLNIRKQDPSLYHDVVKWLAINPKKDASSGERLQNRFKNMIGGAALPTAVMGSFEVGKYTAKSAGEVSELIMKTLKSFKMNRVLNASKRDFTKAKNYVMTKGMDLAEAVKKVKEERLTKAQMKEAKKIADKILPDADKMEDALDETIKKSANPKYEKFINDKDFRANAANRQSLLDEFAKDMKTDKLTREKFQTAFGHTGVPWRTLVAQKPESIFKIVADQSLIAKEGQKMMAKADKVRQEMIELLTLGKDIPDSLALKFERINADIESIGIKAASLGRVSGQQLRAVGFAKEQFNAIDRYAKSVNELQGFTLESLMNQKRLLDAENESTLFKYAYRLEDAVQSITRKTMLLSPKTWMNILQSAGVQSGLQVSTDVVKFAVDKNLPTRAPWKAMKDVMDMELIKQGLSDGIDAFKKGNVKSRVGKIEDLLTEGVVETSRLKQGINNTLSFGQRAIGAIDGAVRPITQRYALALKNYEHSINLAEHFDELQDIMKIPSTKHTPEQAAIVNKIFNKQAGINYGHYKRLNGEKAMSLEDAQTWMAEMVSDSKMYREFADNISDTIAMNRPSKDLELADFIKQPINFMARTPVLRTFTPYVKPFLNSVDRIVEFTPGLNLPRISQRLKDPARRSEAIAQIAVSYSMLGTFIAMKEAKLITGNAPKDFKRKETYLSSHPELGLRIGDGSYISFKGTDLESYISVATDIHDVYKQSADIRPYEQNGYGESLTIAALTIAEAGVDKYAEPMKDLIRFTQDLTNKSDYDTLQKNIGRLVGSIGARFIPSGVKDYRKMIDVKRDTTAEGNTGFGSMINQMKDALPYMSEDMPIRTDFLGRPMEYENIPFTPIKIINKGTKLDKWLSALDLDRFEKDRKSEGESSLKITRHARMISFPGQIGSYKLSPEEYAALEQEITNPKDGISLAEELTQLMEEYPPETIDTPDMKNLVVEEIAAIYNGRKKVARDNFKYDSEDYKNAYRELLEKRQQNAERNIQLETYDSTFDF